MDGKHGTRLIQIDYVFKCHIVKRVNRFVVEVIIDGNNYRASINNTGRLEQFLV